MILRPLQPAQAFYRFNTPRWAYRPTSGAGAAKVGGRFNRPGVDALYLSRRIETATAEYQQNEPLMPPGTLVTYEVELTSIVDFGKGYSHREWDELWSDWDCAWRRQACMKESSHQVGFSRTLRSSAARRAFCSPQRNKPAGCNLVVYTQQLDDGDKLSAHDPRGDLPRNQESWLR